MGWMSFVASLIQSAAWPLAVFALVYLLRKPLAEAVSQRLLRLKAGPLEAEFDREAVAVREEVRQIPEVAAVEPRDGPVSLADELAPLILISPASAVMQAFMRIEQRLVELLESAGQYDTKRPFFELAMMASRSDLINPETLKAIDGLRSLRNLVAHGTRDEIGVDRAREFVALADAVLYAMRDKPLP